MPQKKVMVVVASVVSDTVAEEVTTVRRQPKSFVHF